MSCLLVYRDRLVPRSEAQFLRRMYAGFSTLDPYWIGTHLGDGIEGLGAEPHVLGRSAIDRALFKQVGRVPNLAALRDLKPVAIHAHFGRGGALALPIARALEIPLAVTFHGGDATKTKHYQPGVIPTIFQRRLAALQREAAAFHCVSDHIAKVLRARGFPEHKLVVVHNGVPIPPTPPTLPARPPYLLFVGRFVAKKGIFLLLDAIRMMTQSGSGVRLVCVGDGPQSAAVQQAAKGLPVEFTGWLPPEGVALWMREAWAVCVPSITAASGDQEGLPSVAIEAMALGVPVIGSLHAGIGEAVFDKESGLLVPEGDLPALTDALTRMINEPGLRARLGQGARARAAAGFDQTKQSAALERLLLGMVAPVRA